MAQIPFAQIAHAQNSIYTLIRKYSKYNSKYSIYTLICKYSIYSSKYSIYYPHNGAFHKSITRVVYCIYVWRNLRMWDLRKWDLRHRALPIRKYGYSL